jgi:branched-chain amino acid transport system permease protein
MDYIIHISILISIYAILGVSLNLIVGFTGMLSITHAAFYGIGAYATAILMISYGFGFAISIILGMLISGVIGLTIGYVLSKLEGDYFTLGSFGFNIIVSSILINSQSFTGGSLGISGITRPSLFDLSFSHNSLFLVLTILTAVIVYILSHSITRSSFGRVLMAIREDEKALQIFGYKTHHYKLAIFVVSAMMAAIAGSLFATYMSFIDPSTFDVSESIFIVSIIILGGLADTKGSVCGAIFLVVLPELLRFIGFPTNIAAELRQIVYGLTLVLLMLYRPQGLRGSYTL